MDIIYLRSEFICVKDFLKQLFSNTPRRNATKLQNASEKELNTLIKILHLICNGQISLKRHDFEVVKKSKRLNFLKNNFESKDKFLKILKASKSEKVFVLKKFCALYANLLFTFFNKL